MNNQERVVERFINGKLNQPEREPYLVNVPTLYFRKELEKLLQAHTLQVKREVVEEVINVIKSAKGHTNEGDAVVDSILLALDNIQDK